MSCPHVAIAHLSPPGAFAQVHKEECTQCFDSQDSENGIDVCLSCFNAGCNDPIRHHAQIHYLKTQHPIVLNIQRVTLDKPKRVDDGTPPPQKISKVAIVPENEEEKYEHLTKVKCYACDGAEVDRTTENLPSIIDSVLASLTYTKQSEIQAWEQEIVPCDHTRNLVQSEFRKLESQSLAHCTRCDLNQNLWLCLVCGNLGCGRQQYGSDVGGNGHGLQHFEETGHAVSCKLGTITPEGTADVYCYSCNDERTDPHLAQHLANWGIEVASQQKTERSLAELQLEQNLKFDFSMTLEDGKQLESLFGPGYTGLRNLGNSCYMASVLQSVFALKPFQNRYLSLVEDHPLTCPADSASCLQCQLSKLADGLYSGRYSSPKEPIDSTSPPSQDGIQPAMLKALVGKGHPEFSTMRQQDAYEFFQHFIKMVEQKERASGEDPTRVFQFQLEQRLQCTKCRKVRYQKQVSKDVQVAVPAKIKSRPEGEEVNESGESGESKKEVEYEEVSFEECLDTFIAGEAMDDYFCPNCLEKTMAVKSNRFGTFPEVLVILARRFEYVNWVPQKLSVPINVPLGNINLDKYLGHGLQPGEELLPEDASADSESKEPQVDAAALEQLEQMGFPRVRCQKALIRTGNQGADSAMSWLFEHMEDPDIDDPIEPASGSGSSVPEPSADQITMLADMGFTATIAKKALRETNNDMERAVEWLFSHPDDVMDEDAHVGAGAGAGQQSESTVVGDATPPIDFRVSSFVSHKGTSVHCGHYVAHVRKENDQWVLFNDNKVAATPKPPIGEAYMYVLERVRA